MFAIASTRTVGVIAVICAVVIAPQDLAMPITESNSAAPTVAPPAAPIGNDLSDLKAGFNSKAASGPDLSAINTMAFDDVLLLEAQDLDPAGANSWWPVEVADATYDAILLATALGIVVVEAGGNGRRS